MGVALAGVGVVDLGAEVDRHPVRGLEGEAAEQPILRDDPADGEDRLAAEADGSVDRGALLRHGGEEEHLDGARVVLDADGHVDRPRILSERELTLRGLGPGLGHDGGDLERPLGRRAVGVLHVDQAAVVAASDRGGDAAGGRHRAVAVEAELLARAGAVLDGERVAVAADGDRDRVGRLQGVVCPELDVHGGLAAGLLGRGGIGGEARTRAHAEGEEQRIESHEDLVRESRL